MTDYKKLYAERFGITWDNDLEIHHIDRNRDNNDISNLILLPRELHSELHKWLTEIKHYEDATGKDVITLMQEQVLNIGNTFVSSSIVGISNVLSKCMGWGFLKAVRYRNCDGGHIGHITKDTMKWNE
jgi:hypothetical protein